MADGTKIEWTDATVNAVNGCSVISPGCKHCYAMKQAHRFPVRQGLTVKTAGGMVWTGEVRLNETALLQPLRWKRPRKIFWNAHGDLFHEDVPDEWIDRVFASCALSPQHQHQILTKRSARMRDYFANPEVVRRVLTAARELRYSVTPDPDKRPRQFQRVMSASARLTAWTVIGGVASDIFLRTEPGRTYPSWVTWPLPNVWLGVSVEDQQRANERIPHLLATPAVVRFLSCEPLLGPVNLASAMRPRQPLRLSEMPATWREFEWPAWVPEQIGQRIEDFWRESYGRGPRAWLRDAISQGGPDLWSRATIRRSTQAGEPVSGRFVHLWNNIACVVQPDGNVQHGSFAGSGVYAAVIENERGIDWVIVGGESGPGARPMHPGWVRSIRDQCFVAGVPLFFKQWGAWVPLATNGDGYWPADKGGCIRLLPDGTRSEHGWPMQFVGKGAAGHLLDGGEHRGMPA